jgi:transcription antitermination factor NusG
MAMDDWRDEAEEQGAGEAPATWHAAYTGAGAEVDAYLALLDVEGVEPLLAAWRIASVKLAAKADPDGLRKALFFPRYVLLRGVLHEELRRRIEDIDAIHAILGTKASGPSPIPEAQVALVQHLMGLERRPELGSMPEKGRRAIILDGPMKGIEGLVTWRNKTHARLVTEIQLLGRAVEITAPLDTLVLAEYVTAKGEYRPRHRGGKRARRAARIVDAA